MENELSREQELEYIKQQIKDYSIVLEAYVRSVGEEALESDEAYQTARKQLSDYVERARAIYGEVEDEEV